MQGESVDAIEDLLSVIAEKGARAIITFPDHECSNGLSGEIIRELSADHFRIRVTQITSKFSTLGGTKVGEGAGRGGRHYRNELILVLDPK